MTQEQAETAGFAFCLGLCIGVMLGLMGSLVLF